MNGRKGPTHIQVNNLSKDGEQIGVELVWEGNGWKPNSAWIIAYNDSIVDLDTKL